MEERPISVAMRVTLVVRVPVGWVTKKTAGKPQNGEKMVKRRRRQTWNRFRSALLARNRQPQIKKHLLILSK